MEMRELTIRKREGIGKGPARRLRRAGQVPATLYGGASPVNVAVDAQGRPPSHPRPRGQHPAVPGDLRGDHATRKMAIIRDMQFDPVSENLIHVDLQEVAMDRAIQVTVAVHHVGEAIGVKDTQGILEMVLREVRVSCLPGNIPEYLEADITNLAIHDVLTVKDLKVPEGVRVLNDPNQAVVTVAPPAAEEAVVAAAATTEATAAEPEVLTERKPKEEEAVEADAKDKGEKKK